MHKCLAYTRYYIQHSENSEYEPGQKLKKLASQLVLLKSASSVYSRRLGSQLYTNTLYAILCWVSEQNEQVHSENYYFFAWKLISFHFSSMFYAIYSGSQDLSQIC